MANDLRSIVSKSSRIETLDGHTNMARDIAMLHAAEQGAPGWRVYGWDGPWVSLGRFQRPSEALLNIGGATSRAPGIPFGISLEGELGGPTSSLAEHSNRSQPTLREPPQSHATPLQSHARQIPWVMRPTGGKAVLHGHDITVGIALPLACIGETGRSVKGVYIKIVRPIVDALRASGMPAALAVETPFSGRGRRVADCFAHISPNDVVHESLGVKVCGCALRLTQSAVLVQASIPAGTPLIDPGLIFKEPAAVPQIPWNSERFAMEFDRAINALLGCGSTDFR